MNKLRGKTFFEKTLLCILIAAIFATLLVGCTDGGNYQTECLFSLGTALNLVAYTDGETFEKLVADTKKILAYAESLNDENGPVEKFNSASFGDKTELDETVYNILKTVKEDPSLDGFNPLFAPLIDLWGFSLRFNDEEREHLPYDRERAENGGFPLPDKKYIEAFLSLTDLDLIVLSEEDGKYYCEKNIPPVTVDGVKYEAKLDLGGCIKGYCTDEIRKLYENLGINYGYISFGTSSISLLLNKSGDWKLALTSPENPQESYLKIDISSGNASTSGDYENFYETDGERYCHIIGKDGYPVKNARSVTVIGSSALYCDMLSTALMTVPLDEIDEKINTLPCKIVYSFGEGDSFDAIIRTAID